jgi:hypothetical protein
MNRYSSNIKYIIKKPIFWIGLLVCFFLIRYLFQKSDDRIDRSRINDHFSSLDLSIKPQNEHREKYDLLIEKFQKLKKIKTIAHRRGGILFGISCKIIGDYFTTPKLNGKYAKVESDSSRIRFPFPTNHIKDFFEMSDIEQKEEFSYKDITDIFRLMKNLDIKWISHNKNYIEFSSYVYPADESLDYYNGYIYCLNDSFPNINKNEFYLLYHLERNWYYFVRDTYKGQRKAENYQYLDNLNKLNDKKTMGLTE